MVKSGLHSLAIRRRSVAVFGLLLCATVAAAQSSRLPYPSHRRIARTAAPIRPTQRPLQHLLHRRNLPPTTVEPQKEPPNLWWTAVVSNWPANPHLEFGGLPLPY